MPSAPGQVDFLQDARDYMSLDAIVTTSELDRRQSRLPDLEAENRALKSLMEELARPDGDMWHALADHALALCGGHAAGVALLEDDGRHGYFWHAVAGEWSAYLDGAVPRAFGPDQTGTGTGTLLMTRPDRSSPDGVPAAEVLLVPFHSGQRPVGTICVLVYDENGRFDAEDRRLLVSLSHVAALAYRLLTDQQQRLRAELADARRLQAISAELVRDDGVEELYEKILDAAMSIMSSQFASMQMVSEDRGAATGPALKLLGQRNFSPWAVENWASVDVDGRSSCADALRHGRRCIIPDVLAGEALTGSEELDALIDDGIRALQSTPLLSRSGELVGMISTHWSEPHEPSERDLRLFDILARQAADLIERNRSAAALAESEDKYRKLFEALGDSEQRFRALVTATSDALFTVSADWSEMLHLHGTEFVTDTTQPTRDWLDTYVHRQDLPRVLEVIDEAIRTRSSFELEHRVMRSDGSPGWAFSRAVPICDERGDIVEWFGAASDVTERKQSEETLRQHSEALEQSREALQRADRNKDEFLAMLAHELRNPLAPISSALQTIRIAGVDSDAARTAAQIMDRQVDQLIRLVDDLLDVSRITHGKIELRKERMELDFILQQAVDTIRPMCDDLGHRLTVTPAPQPVYLDGDPARLTQVFTNLLNNACRYMAKGGWVRLSAEAAHDGPGPACAIVRVADGGIGLDQDQLARIFDMFTQVDTSLERAQSGLGIGLTVVRNIVEMHGGRVEAYSDGPGRGSEFVVSLPASVQEATATVEDSQTQVGSAAQPDGRHRILVVDDNRDSAETLALLLQLAGHETATAYNGLEAIETADAVRPDVVLLDIGMPELNGFETCRRIRERSWGKDIVLIAQTGWGQAEDKRKTAEAGFDAHLVKPVDCAELTELLRGLSPQRGRSVVTSPAS